MHEFQLATADGPEIARPLICCQYDPVSSSRMRKFWLLIPASRNVVFARRRPLPHQTGVTERSIGGRYGVAPILSFTMW